MKLALETNLWNVALPKPVPENTIRRCLACSQFHRTLSVFRNLQKLLVQQPNYNGPLVLEMLCTVFSKAIWDIVQSRVLGTQLTVSLSLDAVPVVPDGQASPRSASVHSASTSLLQSHYHCLWQLFILDEKSHSCHMYSSAKYLLWLSICKQS